MDPFLNSAKFGLARGASRRQPRGRRWIVPDATAVETVLFFAPDLGMAPHLYRTGFRQIDTADKMDAIAIRSRLPKLAWDRRPRTPSHLPPFPRERRSCFFVRR